MSRRLLAISWDMPPLSGPRAVQVSRTLKHLVPLGWESWVVCFGPRSNRYNQDVDLAARLQAPGVTLVPVPSLEERLVFRTLWRVVPPLKMLPDEKWVWIGAAARAAQRLAAERRFDVLVSFAQPFSDHLAGLRVHRATGLPWVAHFSDPWTDSPYLHGAGWQRRLWQRLEADVIRAADALVFVNIQTAEQVMRKYPDEWRGKAHVIPHGFDPGAPPAAPVARDHRLTLVHTGRFYAGVRTPDALLRALAAVAHRRPLARELRVVFVGTPVPSHQRLAASLGLDGIVEFAGRLPFADSAQWAAAADVLLLIDAPAAENLFLPSKLIDYLPAAKPILALTPQRGASADVVRALGYPVVAPDDEAGIAAAIEDLLAAHTAGRLVRSPQHDSVAARYDIRQTAGAFAGILVRCA
jgi:glycosyltransferase involved in cell wall biosynthesis